MNSSSLRSDLSELRSCVKVEVAVLGSRPYGFCGRKATLNLRPVRDRPPPPERRHVVEVGSTPPARSDLCIPALTLQTCSFNGCAEHSHKERVVEVG